MKILLTGRTGQVGWELERALPAIGEVIPTDHSRLDLADADAVRRIVRETKPSVIVNAAAYTAVDRAEDEHELARAVNGVAPGVLAEEARRLGALLVHYSTDYVFDGEKAQPYVEDDAPRPLNVYGSSKLAGERAIAASGCRHFVFRASWVYSARGSNFLLTILRAARERPELRVVHDQVGAPTSARHLADMTLAALQADRAKPRPAGVYHMVASGETSWAGFAQEIVREAGLRTPIIPIASSEYPATVRRPRNSVLDTSKLRMGFGLEPREWRLAMKDVLATL